MLHVTQHCLSTGSIHLFSKCDLFFSFLESLAKVPADSLFWKHTLMTELLCCSSVYLQGTQKSLFLVSISCLTAAKLRIAFSASLKLYSVPAVVLPPWMSPHRTVHWESSHTSVPLKPPGHSGDQFLCLASHLILSQPFQCFTNKHAVFYNKLKYLSNTIAKQTIKH